MAAPDVSPGQSAAATKTTLRIITRGELARSDFDPGWSDPAAIAALTPEKRQLILNNPFARGENDPVQIIGLQGDTVVGRMDVLPGQITVNGEVLPVLWTSHLIVPPEFRSTLVGLMIVLKYQGLHPTVAACAVSRMVHPIYEKLKWVDFRMPRYLWLRRSRSIVRRYVGSGFLGALARVVADAGLLVHRAFLAVWRIIRTKGLHCTAEASMSPEFDQRLKGTGKPAAVTRTAAFVNWIVANSLMTDPRNRRGLYYVRDREKVLGYFVVTARFHEKATHRELPDLLLGSIKDWFIFEPRRLSLTQIVLLATGVMSQWGVDAMEVCLPDPAEVKLGRLGFVRAGELNLLFKAGRGSPVADARFADAAAWWFRPAEGDNAFG